MSIFDPKLEGGAAFVQPSQQPSAAQAVASGITNIGSALLTVAQKDQQAQDQYDKAMADAQEDAASTQAKLTLQRELKVAQALRKAGRVSEAVNKENNALANATASGFNFGSTEGKAIVETSLGRPFEAVGLTQEEYLNKRLLSDQEFMERDYLATYAYDAELTEAQRFEIAKLNKARTEQAKLAIEQRGLISQNNWDTQGRAIYDQIFTSEVNPILGKLQLAAQQGVNVDPQSVVQAKLRFQSTVSSLPRPQNITDAQWESWSSKVKGVNDLFDSFINRGTQIKAAIGSAFLQAVSENKDLTPNAQYLIANAPDEMLMGAGEAVDVVTQLKAMNVPSYVDINVVGNPVQFPQATSELKTLEEGVEGSDAKDLLGKSVTLGKTLENLSGVGFTADSDKLKGFVNETYRSAVALQKMSFDWNDYASGGDIRKIYNGTILGGIQQVAKVNPDAAQALLNKHIEALDTQYATGQSKLNRMYQGLFSMDENGMVSVNPDRWESRYGGREGFVGAVPEELTKALVEYNGDVVSLIRDKGARYQGGLNPSIKFFVDSSDAKVIVEQGSAFAGHMDALKSIDAVRRKFYEASQELNKGIIEIGTGASRPEFQVLYDMGVPVDELNNIVTKESSFNPKAVNPDSGAVGLFQFSKAALKDLGYSREDILSMSAEEQANVYKQYLVKWGWKPGVPLAQMQAAPATVGKADDTIVYPAGSLESQQNKAWWADEEGNVTVGSIKEWGRQNGSTIEPSQEKVMGSIIPEGVVDAVGQAVSDVWDYFTGDNLPVPVPNPRNNYTPPVPRERPREDMNAATGQPPVPRERPSVDKPSPEVAELITNYGRSFAGWLLGNLPASNLQAFGNYLRGKPVTAQEIDLSESDMKVLKDVALKAYNRRNKSIRYSDYGFKDGKSVLTTGDPSLSFRSPEFRMATFIGRARVFKEGNDLILEDVYDFNPGPKRNKLKEALFAREAGNLEDYYNLKKEALEGANWFESLSIWAGALNFNDTEEDKGNKIRINLGPVSE